MESKDVREVILCNGLEVGAEYIEHQFKAALKSYFFVIALVCIVNVFLVYQLQKKNNPTIAQKESAQLKFENDHMRKQMDTLQVLNAQAVYFTDIKTKANERN